MSLFAQQFAAANARLKAEKGNDTEQDVALESFEADFNELDQILDQAEQDLVMTAEGDDVTDNIPGEKNEDIEVVPAEAATEGLVAEGVESVVAEDRPTDGNIGDDITVVPGVSVPEVDGEPVHDDKDSGDVDYEDADVTAEEEQMLEEYAADVDILEAYGSEVEMVSETVAAIESYGLHPTTAIVMRTTGLLAGTALAGIATEAYGIHTPEDPESLMAIESLTDKVKEKASQWAAKIVSMAKGFGDKIMGVLSPIWEKLSAAVKKAGEYVGEKGKAGVEYAKAHPYKTVLGVVLAIAAVAGIVAFSAGKMPSIGATGEAVKAWLKSIGDKISALKTPLGSFKASVAESGKKIAVKFTAMKTSVSSGTAKALGWSKESIAELGAKLARSWTSLQTAVKAFGTKAMSMAGAAKNTVVEVGKAGVDKAKAAGAATAAAGKTAVAGAKSFGGKAADAGKTAVGVAKDLAENVGDAGFKTATQNGASYTGGRVAGYTAIAVMSAGFGAILGLIIRVVAAGFRMIKNALSALMGGKSSEEATA